MKAFEEIYSLYHSDVYKFICKMANYNINIAEDLLQETFYQAFISFDRFRGDCEIKTWLCQIAKNTYYRHIRNEIKKEKLTERICLSYHGAIDDFTEQAENKELLQAIHKILGELDDRTRNIVLYRMYAELKFSEIAALTGIKESTAKVIYSRAKVKIIVQLKEEYGYEI